METQKAELNIARIVRGMTEDIVYSEEIHYKENHYLYQQWSACVLRATLITSEDTSSAFFSSDFLLFQTPLTLQSTVVSQLEPANPDFYKIGYVRSMRAYGIEFKDIASLHRARVVLFQLIMEIPLKFMLTISQRLSWMFFPNIIPVGHPIFDIINSTNPEDKKMRMIKDSRLGVIRIQSLNIIHSMGIR